MLEIDEPWKCGIGEGANCCAFLTVPSGVAISFACGRTDASLSATIRLRLLRGTMNALYDPGNVPYPECQTKRKEE